MRRTGSIGCDVPSYFQSLKHLLRYRARPSFALERLSVIRGADGRIRYAMPRHKAANWVGPGRGRKSTRTCAHGLVELAPFEFLDRLADLIPAAAQAPAQVSRGVCVESPAAAVRHGTGDPASEETAGRSRLPSNRRFASGRRPGWLRSREPSSSHTSANRSHRRQSRQLAGRPPTGTNSSGPMTIATSFRDG
jgi:hypothetical protein